jgi:hypothetical protein
MAESERGYYFLGGPDNSYLFYMDKKSMKPVVLCNKPDCLHYNESDPKKVLYCNACFYLSNKNLIYNGSNLYVVGKDFTGNDDYVLIQTSLDGTNRKTIYHFKDAPSCLIIHRGYIYYTTDDNGTVSGMESTTSSKAGLYRIPLNNTNKETELIYEQKGVYCKPGKLIGFKNGIYWFNTWFGDSSMTKYTSALYKYDIENNTVSVFGNNIGNFAINDTKIVYYSVPDGEIYSIDLKSTIQSKLNIEKGLVSADNNYIYVDNFPQKITDGDTTKRKLFVYSLNGELIRQYDIDQFGYDLSYGGADYIFFPDNHNRSNEYGDIKALWALDKKTIEKDGNFKKMYEFMPIVTFPGIKGYK